MVTADGVVVCFGEVGGRQELFDRKMRKFYDRGVFHVDDGKQAGTCRQYRIYWIFEAQLLVKFWNRSGLEIECENFREFFHTERAGSHGNALEQSMDIFRV